jgi:hypothetical protein
MEPKVLDAVVCAQAEACQLVFLEPKFLDAVVCADVEAGQLILI